MNWMCHITRPAALLLLSLGLVACGTTGKTPAEPTAKQATTPGEVRSMLWAVSYTHLTLPTICSV